MLSMYRLLCTKMLWVVFLPFPSIYLFNGFLLPEILLISCSVCVLSSNILVLWVLNHYKIDTMFIFFAFKNKQKNRGICSFLQFIKLIMVKLKIMVNFYIISTFRNISLFMGKKLITAIYEFPKMSG